MSWVERKLKIIQFQPPAVGKFVMQQSRLQSPIQSGFEHVQG